MGGRPMSKSNSLRFYDLNPEPEPSDKKYAELRKRMVNEQQSKLSAHPE